MDISRIRGVALFTGLDDAQLNTVASVLRERRVAPGVAILTEGERSTSLFILATGAVGTSRRMGLAARGPVDPASEKVLVHLRAPQFFGEMGLITDLDRSATVKTDTESEVLELTREDFARLTGADPQLGFLLMRNIAVVLAERLRRADLDMLKLTTALSLALGNR